MPNKFQNLIAKAKELSEQIKADPKLVADDNVRQALLLAKETLELVLLEMNLIQATKSNETLTNTKIIPDDVSHEEFEANKEAYLEGLRSVADYRVDQTTQKTVFLLHRPTNDGEYGAALSEDGLEFTPADKTDWAPDFINCVKWRIGHNPVISCWINEDDIENIPEYYKNTGVYGDLGENPFTELFVIKAKPGRYQIHTELRE